MNRLASFDYLKRKSLLGHSTTTSTFIKISCARSAWFFPALALTFLFCSVTSPEAMSFAMFLLAPPKDGKAGELPPGCPVRHACVVHSLEAHPPALARRPSRSLCSRAMSTLSFDSWSTMM
jgi:hypothetical protein